MSRVLITGGLGTLGSAISKQLLQEETTTVVVLDSNPVFTPHPSARLHLISGDYTNSELLSDILKRFEINYIIDCVSQSRKTTGISPKQGAQIALQGLTNLLDVTREYGKIQSFVLLSNQAVYGKGKQIETEPLAPITFYGAALMGAEAMLHSYVISYKVPAAIARVTEGIIEKLPQTIEKLNDPVNLMTAHDAAAAVLQISRIAQNGKIYNVGGPYDYDLSDVKMALSSSKICELKDNKRDSSFSTERLRIELGFVSENDFNKEFGMPTINAGTNVSRTKILLFSEKTTNFPTALCHFEKNKNVVVAETSPGYDDDETVKNEIIQQKPTIVLWIANPKENITVYEGGPDVLRENMNDHLLGPWLVSSYCYTMGMKFVYVNLENTSPSENNNTSFSAVKNFVKPLLNHFPGAVILNSSVSTFEKDVKEHIAL